MLYNIIFNIFTTAIDESTTNNCNDKKSGMRSVLVYVRNKSSKKSVSWKQESDLVKVSYFEHDETERGNLYRNYFIFVCYNVPLVPYSTFFSFHLFTSIFNQIYIDAYFCIKSNLKIKSLPIYSYIGTINISLTSF